MRIFAQKNQPQQKSSANRTRSNRLAPAARQRAHPLLHLQRTIGNQAVLRLLRVSADGLETASAIQNSQTPATERFAHDFSRTPVHAPAPMTIQPKLAVNTPGDSYEQEADHISEQVMRMPEPKLQRACACGGGCPHCNAKPSQSGAVTVSQPSQEHQRLQTKHVGSSNAGQSMAPPIVHEVLRSPGRPLDAATRAFMEPRFGHDLSRVRVHTDVRAADSARAVNALAYTVGRNVVFGAGQFQPGTASGRSLLAHEFAHVVQQNEAPFPSLQRACRSAAQCSVPSQGNPGQVGIEATAEAQALEVASGGAPGTCVGAHHGDPATKVTALVTGAGLGVTIPPEVAGIFVNACLPPRTWRRTDCSDFPGGAPAGAAPAKSCVQVHVSDEADAAGILAKPGPRSGADNKTVLNLASIIKHESQHASFNAAASGVVPAAVDCNLGTDVHFPGGTDTVKHLLSEMSAEIAEFDVFFKNTKSSPDKASAFALQTEEHDIASRSPENILGIVKTLQCGCECNTVDTFTKQVFNDAASSWTADEKTEFQRAMTGFIPSFWPKALHKK